MRNNSNQQCITNANVITIDKNRPKATTIVIDSGRIVAVGEKTEFPEILRDYSNIIDLEGRTVIPGFIDAHTHLASTGISLSLTDLSNTSTRKETLTLIKESTASTAEGEWVIARGWDESSWKDEKRYLYLEDLNRISPDNPACAFRVCGHLISMNSLGIAKLGIPLNDPHLIKNDEGQFTGLIKEMLGLGDRIGLSKRAKKGILDGVGLVHSLGITTVHDNLQISHLEAYQSIHWEKSLRLRIVMNPPEELLDHIISLGIKSSFGDEVLRFGGVKIFTDGSFGAQTALLSQEFEDAPTKGVAFQTSEELSELILKCSQAGLQVVVHAIGDAALEKVLTVFEENKAQVRIPELRHRIEHAEFLTEDQIERIRKLGIRLSMQPNFLKWEESGGLYETRLGKERYLLLNNFRKILDAGAKVSFGSDGMPLGPLYGISLVCSHFDDQIRISPQEALECYTLGSAEVAFEEDIKGSIQQGKVADLVILSENPLDTPPEKIKDIEVIATLLGGKPVFDPIGLFS